MSQRLQRSKSVEAENNSPDFTKLPSVDREIFEDDESYNKANEMKEYAIYLQKALHHLKLQTKLKNDTLRNEIELKETLKDRLRYGEIKKKHLF